MKAPSPSIVVASLALFFAAGGSALALGRATAAASCGNGSVKAYAAVNLDRFSGGPPTAFTANPQLFSGRYSCARRSPEVRAVPGGFEIRFPGIASQTAVVSSLGPEAGYASWDFSGGVFQVRVMRHDGQPSAYGFSIAVY